MFAMAVDAVRNASWAARAFVAANALDAFTTYAGLEQGGVEANPLLSASLGIYGPIPTLFFKVAAAAGIAYLIRNQRHRVLWTAAAVIGTAAGFNAYFLLTP
jgi:hypothetical protein